MSLNFFGKGAGIDGKGIYGIRKAIIAYDNNASDGTNADELEHAVGHFKGVTSPIDSSEVTDASAALSLMKTDVLLGNPVIVFLDATVLGRGYNGHWLVLTGFSYDSSNVVYVNAPDSDYLRGEAKTLKESDLITAMSTNWAKKQGQPYGIIVG